MYTISKEVSFSAAHSLRNYQGKCENIHGHNWKVRATVKSNQLNDLGMVADFREIKKILQEIVDRFDHQNINEVPPFDQINPSSENLARFIFEESSKRINNEHLKASQVKVWEAETSCASYGED